MSPYGLNTMLPCTCSMPSSTTLPPTKNDTSALCCISLLLHFMLPMNDNRVCLVCTRQFAEYNCPRCNIAYCSLICYRGHGESCTQKFYQEQILQQAKEESVTAAQRENMQDILMRVQKKQHEQEGMQDRILLANGGGNADGTGREQEKGLPLNDEERMYNDMARLAMDSDISLDKLTPEQRVLFLRAVASGSLSNYLEVWDPWWSKNSEHASLVVEIGGEKVDEELGSKKGIDHLVSDRAQLVGDDDSATDDEEEKKFQCALKAECKLLGAANMVLPPLPSSENLPSITFHFDGSSSTSSQTSALRPSPALAFNLIDILYAFAFCCRVYNGDLFSDAPACALLMLSSSSVLSSNAVFNGISLFVTIVLPFLSSCCPDNLCVSDFCCMVLC